LSDRDSRESEDLGYWRKHPNLHGYIINTFAEGVVFFVMAALVYEGTCVPKLKIQSLS
jgi:hypothetical protein